MVRALIAGLLLVGCLPAQAEIIRYRGTDGRLYFTNTPLVGPQVLRQSAQGSSFPSHAHTSQHGILRLIHDLARQHDIEPRLIQAIIAVESNFNPRAISHAGAQGLMQLMPHTAARYHVDDPFNPRANIEGGIRYLKELLRLFPGDLRLVLAAYNAGEGAVRRYGRIPPYAETRRYIERVMALYRRSNADQKIYRYRMTNGSILFTNTPREVLH